MPEHQKHAQNDAFLLRVLDNSFPSYIQHSKNYPSSTLRFLPDWADLFAILLLPI
jgi:hypothetical protein